MIVKIIRSCAYLIIDFSSGLFVNKYITDFDTVIVKPDAVGDFVMFAPFLSALTKSLPLDSKILVIGNTICREIASDLRLPSNVHFVWVDRRLLNRNFVYRFKFMRKLRRFHGKSLMCPIYSVDNFCADSIVKVVSSDAKHAMRNTGRRKFFGIEGKWSEIFSHNVNPIDNRHFEIERHQSFFSSFLEKKGLVLGTINTDILKECSINLELPSKYFVVFIGASDRRRRWSEEKFLDLCKEITRVYSGAIVICGSPEDRKRLSRLSVVVPHKNIINLAGKTSLRQLIEVIRGCDFLVSNESCAPHMAYLTSTKCFVISNGNHLGRFCPYPNALYPEYNVILHPKIELLADSAVDLVDTFASGSNLEINDIPVSTVLKSITERLQSVD